MALSQVATDRRLNLCEPSVWTNIQAYFCIPAEHLYTVADSESTGSFDILRGGPMEPVFAASVRPYGSCPRALLLSAATMRERPLASCAATSSRALYHCAELELRGQDNRFWGTLIAQGSDIYSVYQSGTRQVLVLEGDQANGRLVVWLGDEVVAHAARGPDGEHLEVGVRPQIDPVLMLICVLAVVIFNPEDASSDS